MFFMNPSAKLLIDIVDAADREHREFQDGYSACSDCSEAGHTEVTHSSDRLGDACSLVLSLLVRQRAHYIDPTG